MAGTMRDWLLERAPDWLLRDRGGEYLAIFGALGDSVLEACAIAGLQSLILDVESPDDALALFGAERRLRAYPGETAAAYRARLHRAWEDYASPALAIPEQLAAAGYPGALLEFRPTAPGPRGEPPPYWSQFWVRFPTGTHPVQAPTTKWGAFVWGNGEPWGPNVAPEFVALIKGIVKKWKPSRWICRGFLFEFEAAKWGAFTWGDGTHWDSSWGLRY